MYNRLDNDITINENPTFLYVHNLAELGLNKTTKKTVKRAWSSTELSKTTSNDPKIEAVRHRRNHAQL